MPPADAVADGMTGDSLGALADLRFALKALARRPGTTTALVLTMALGLGGNAVVLAFVTGFRGRTPPAMEHGPPVVSVFSRQEGGGLDLLSFTDYAEVTQHSDVFELVGAVQQSLAAIDLETRSLVGTVATLSPEARAMFGLPAGTGIIVSQQLTQTSGEAGGAVRGPPPIAVDGIPQHVIGVAPDGLDGLYVGRPVALWRVSNESSLIEGGRAGRTLAVFGRLRAGVTPSDVEAALNATRESGALLVVAPYTGLPPEATAGITRLSRLLSAAVLVVFLIACANVAVFMLSSVTARSRDTAIRISLGAGRHVLVRAVLVECVSLLAFGGGAGLLAAYWTSQIIPSMLFESEAATLVFAPEISALLWNAIMSAAIILCCGVLPLLESRQDRPADLLKRPSIGGSQAVKRFQSALVIAQMALCCAMLVSAGFVLEVYRATLRTPSSGRLDNAMLATVRAGAGFARPDLGLQYFEQGETAIATLPDVSGWAWAGKLPGAEPSWRLAEIEPPIAEPISLKATFEPFLPASLRDVVMPPLAGRMFGGGDVSTSCRVAVVNEAAAAPFDKRAVGRIIQDDAARRFEIIGVVKMKGGAAGSRENGPRVYFYPEQGSLAERSDSPVAFRSQLPPASRAWLNATVISRSYFELVGLHVREGSIFDNHPSLDVCRVGVLNRQAAEQYFSGKAVGGAIVEASGRRTTIVGVVEEHPLRSTQRRVEPTIYLPMWQDYQPRMSAIVAGGVQTPDESRLRETIERVNGGVRGATSVVSLEAYLARTSLPAERVGAILIAAAAANGLILGILGMYRATTDDVLRRRREIAVRSALGAPRWHLMSMVLSQTGRWILQGGILGLLIALGASRWLRSATGVDADGVVWVWFAAPAFLLAAGLIASAMPMRRILRVDPLAAMRITE